MRPASSTGAGNPLDCDLPPPELKPPENCWLLLHTGALRWRGPNCFAAFSIRPFSFLHMVNRAFRLVSNAFSRSSASNVSLRIWLTLRSCPFRSKCFTVSAKFLSRFLVKEGPGLSARMRMSMIALYWTCGVL